MLDLYDFLGREARRGAIPADLAVGLTLRLGAALEAMTEQLQCAVDTAARGVANTQRALDAAGEANRAADKAIGAVDTAVRAVDIAVSAAGTAIRAAELNARALEVLWGMHESVYSAPAVEAALLLPN
jgi:hypothetical protein